MSAAKKAIRKNFRDACFQRDNYACKMCGFQSSIEKALKDLDAHHISSRENMPYQGYSSLNGITLCKECHIKAEVFHSTGTSHPNYSPDDLYQAIESSFEKALQACKELEDSKQ